jgi:hypothetical protein
MWALENRTPFAAGRGWARDRDGAEVWIVVVKGTFHIERGGALRVVSREPGVAVAPRFRGDPQTTSLVTDAEITLRKPATDILLHGHAYAPAGRPVPQLDACMRVGALVKALHVSGDRHWRVALLGMKPGPPEPFQRMPIVYERAFGGRDPGEPDKHWDPRNPVGRGYALHPDRLAGRPLPNIENPADLIGSPRHHPAPAGFGPIPCHWEPRVKLGGTCDKKWEEERQPLVPEDFDDRFFQSAPADQQVPGHLRGGELVKLFNLTPDLALQFRLPRITLGFETFFADESVRHQARIHALVLEPDVPRFQIVWQTQLPCHSKVVHLRKTRILVKQRRPLGSKATVAAGYSTAGAP